MAVKVKKTSEGFKEKVNKIRSQSKDELKKYKKIIPEERYKNIDK